MPKTASAAKDEEGTWYHGFLTPQKRGVVSLPAQLLRRMRVDIPGCQIEVTEREDGVFEFRPVLPVPVDQTWFWTARWQKMEREAEQDIAAGRVALFDDVKDFLAELDS